MKYSKKELIGRKIKGRDIVYTLIEQCGKLGVAWDDNTFFGSATNPYTIQDWNRYIERGSWILLPEELKTYTTPKGIKYRVGTKFRHKSSETVYTINKLDPSLNRKIDIGWEGTPHFVEYQRVELEQNLDSHDWIILQDYQQVDPSTIKFDFTNTKIKVNSPEESEWIQKVAFNNGLEWGSGKGVKYTECKALYFDIYIGKTDTATDFFENESDEYKEITIRDILNNQMKEVIEVGDTVEYKNPKLYGVHLYTVESIKDAYATFKDNAGVSVETLHKLYKVVSKANKQEIIGYELLKDLPGIPKGTKSNNQNAPNHYKFSANNSADAQFNWEQIKDITWFKPIYKAKEVVVKISSNRSVTIVDKTTVRVNMSGYIGDIKVSDIKYTLEAFNSLGQIAGYNVAIKEFQLGCQTFTIKDLQDINSAIQNLK